MAWRKGYCIFGCLRHQEAEPKFIALIAIGFSIQGLNLQCIRTCLYMSMWDIGLRRDQKCMWEDISFLVVITFHSFEKLAGCFFSDTQIRPFLGKISLTWNCSELENNCEVFYAISISIPIIPIVRFNVYKIIHIIYIYIWDLCIYLYYICAYIYGWSIWLEDARD